jgi:hypothetical protein
MKLVIVHHKYISRWRAQREAERLTAETGREHRVRGRYGGVFGYEVIKEVRLPDEDVCPQCKTEDCLGPHVAANQGGCRMHTWLDVG